MIDNKHENLLANYDWSFPVPIAYGPGRLREMGEHATNFELTKPLIVTDQGSAGLPFIDTLQHALLSAGIGSEVFAEVAPNPRASDIVLARNAYLEGGHDSVIAIGGGSGMDAGKSTALTAHNQCDIWHYFGPRPFVSKGIMSPSQIFSDQSMRHWSQTKQQY